jgi:NAD+ synthase
MTDRPLAILLWQCNPVMGDIAGNLEQARAALRAGVEARADLVVLPEMSMLGYPPEDLVLKPAVVRDCLEAVGALAASTVRGGPGIVVGVPWRAAGRLYNAAVMCGDGAIVHVALKVELPNYAVFDEKRIFAPGAAPSAFDWRGHRIGLAICEDVWFADVPAALAADGASILVVVNGSPFRRGVHAERLGVLGNAARQTGLPLVYVNQVGGQDELVFDGGSMCVDARAGLVAGLPVMRSASLLTRWQRGMGPGLEPAARHPPSYPEEAETVWRAMALGLGDYVDKNGFAGVVLGLSGGIDSALTAVLAVDALGADRVWCVMMPSVFTAEESLRDSRALIARLGCRYDIVPIGPGFDALRTMIAPLREGQAGGLTEENLQSRIRGMTLMALSNAFGPMVLTTGNKSEMAVGYATLYGDMCGGFNVLKDLYKTEVYAMARWRNGASAAMLEGLLGPVGDAIPQNIITRTPSAELRPDQTDQDSLPPYETLDRILRALIEDEAEIADLVAKGEDRATVERVDHLLHLAEYKRRQAPPGVKLGRRNFGRDRRYPITNRFRDRD